MLTTDMISDLIQGLQNIFGSVIEQIILYGSVARNDATEESDVDIAIILMNEMDDRVFSIIDINKEKMEQWGRVLPFYQNIQKEGIVLWRAA